MADGIVALCGALRTVGIECVFGVPGTQTVQLFEGFRRAHLRTVLASHELGASFMANGYFRATGKIAALTTIPGPGFTYALTGLAEARLDSVGLLYLVGKPATQPGRRFQLQAIDQRSIAAPLVKACFIADTPHSVAKVIADAYDMALDGEPGPVMVELDFAALLAESGPSSESAASRSAPSNTDLGTLKELFDRAERPVFLLGQGAFAAAHRLEKVAEALTIPVITTPSARGIVAEDNPLVLGFDPLRGHTSELNRWLDSSDLVIGLGCKLSHNGTAGFGLRLPPDTFVHVDADPSVLGANYQTRLSVAARVEDAAVAFEARQTPTHWANESLADIRKTVRTVPPDQPEPRFSSSQSDLKPIEFFAWLRRVLPRDAIVVTDSGLHQILTRRYFDVLSPRGLIVPSDFQSMGFGLPAAIGAKLASPDRLVLALIGDGGFLMSGLELLTARRENTPLVAVVFNDGQLNQIRLQQWTEFGHAHAVELLNPDYGALAASLGIGYFKFGTDADAHIELALRGAVPVLIEVVVGDSLAMRVLPTVARAKSLARRSLGPRLRNWLKKALRRGTSA